ncbi:MAG: citrate lyase subunit alpha [Thermoplasmata archaeon]|nr:citrate lyase subunit alpha [Thermoplasmata archaeon]
MINAVGREIPVELDGMKLRPFTGLFDNFPTGRKAGGYFGSHRPGDSKLLDSIDEAIDSCGLKDGMTVSFHHHLRNGDYVTNMVMKSIAEKGLKDITIAPSALFPCHAPLVDLMDQEVITRIEGSANGPVGDAISHGRLKGLSILRSHGGRVRAIESGELEIDVAFIAAPTADDQGNANGIHGRNTCGFLGYAMVDSMHARKVVVVTDNLVEYPSLPIQISADYVDYIVPVSSIGDNKKIVSGTTKIATDPQKLSIAQAALDLIVHSGTAREKMNFQAGAGGISLATTRFLGDWLKENNMACSFIDGGVTEHLIEIYNEGGCRKILNGQAFDVKSIKDMLTNNDHVAITPNYYANPWNKGCLVNILDTVVLGATEADINFNINVNTHSDGRLLHGIGGHQDTAAGAKLAIMMMPVFRKTNAIIRNRVTTVSTPFQSVDAIVTDMGIAINPARKDLLKKLEGSPLNVVAIEDLRDIAYAETGGVPEEPEYTDRIVSLVQFRDGTYLDTIHQLKE